MLGISKYWGHAGVQGLKLCHVPATFVTAIPCGTPFRKIYKDVQGHSVKFYASMEFSLLQFLTKATIYSRHHLG